MSGLFCVVFNAFTLLFFPASIKTHNLRHVERWKIPGGQVGVLDTHVDGMMKLLNSPLHYLLIPHVEVVRMAHERKNNLHLCLLVPSFRDLVPSFEPDVAFRSHTSPLVRL